MYSEQVYLNWIFRIVLATLCGCAIGYERTSRNKSAGIRTHAIIALGSSMFMIISKYEYSTHSEPHRPALRATYSII